MAQSSSMAPGARQSSSMGQSSSMAPGARQSSSIWLRVVRWHLVLVRVVPYGSE